MIQTLEDEWREKEILQMLFTSFFVRLRKNTCRDVRCLPMILPSSEREAISACSDLYYICPCEGKDRHRFNVCLPRWLNRASPGSAASFIGKALHGTSFAGGRDELLGIPGNALQDRRSTR